MTSSLISEWDLLQLCEQGVQLARSAGADQVEVFATSARDAEVSFEKNDLNLTRVATETSFGIRVFYQGRLGFATSNRPEELAEVADEAVAIAKASPADPMHGLPDPQDGISPEKNSVDPELVNLDLETLTQLGMTFLDRVRSQDSRITIDSGSIGVTETVVALSSSQGIQAHYREAEGTGYLFGMAVAGEEVGSFAYDGDSVQKKEDFVPRLEKAFDRFVQKCIGALGAGAGESFRGTILLPPDTVGEFLGDLLQVLCADAVRQGKSPLANKRGQLIASPLLTLIEGGSGLAGYPLCPFDREGIRRQRLPLVEKGILQDFLYDSYEARVQGRLSNGHAQGGASTLPRVGPACLEVLPGSTPMKDLYAVEKGILVTRFSGSSNPVTGDFSGVVKGGFLIQNGEARPILETTLAGNLYTCLQNISAISEEVMVFGGTTAFPALRIEDVSVTAG
jgi:PmbA protein